MPIYEYRCKKCGTAFEHLSRTADDRPSCPECGSKRLEKLISTFSAGRETGGECKCGGECREGRGDGHHCCGAGCRCHGG